MITGAAVLLFALASPALATPLGGATKSIGSAADQSGIELVHHKPGHKMKHRDRGRHFGWVRGKHKGWYKHRRRHHH